VLPGAVITEPPTDVPGELLVTDPPTPVLATRWGWRQRPARLLPVAGVEVGLGLRDATGATSRTPASARTSWCVSNLPWLIASCEASTCTSAMPACR